MDAEKQSSVMLKLSQHREELKLFANFIRNYYLKYKDDPISFDVETLEICLKFIRKLLCDEMEPDRLKSYFGVHVLLYELDYLLSNIVSKFRIEFNNYTIDMNEENSEDLLKALKKYLLTISFIKFDSSSRLCVVNIEYYISKYSQPRSFDELEKFYTVGTNLMDDPCTLILLQELRKLRAESTTISRFSVIIGPSYMGKTQTAFTLANIINVIYVNFVPTVSKNPQRIYSVFNLLAELFKSAILYDIAESFSSKNKRRAKDLIDSDCSFKTLGLIYIIIRTRKIRTDLSGLEWLKELATIRAAIIPLMTRLEFLAKTTDIDFDGQLVFIDELPRNDAEVSLSVKFLRNLCRAIRLPVNISGTNSRIRNMIAKEDASASRSGDEELYPWVQVTVKTPQPSIKSFAHLIKLNPRNLINITRSLNDFINPNTGNVLYASLFRHMYGSNDRRILNQIAPVKKLIEYLVKQSESCIPGIIYLIFIKLFEILPNFTDSKALWRKLIVGVIKEVTKRKNSLKKYSGFLDSAHILTFPSPQKKSLEKGHYSSRLVEKHLFRYGVKGDITFRLDFNLDYDSSDEGFDQDSAEENSAEENSEDSEEEDLEEEDSEEEEDSDDESSGKEYTEDDYEIENAEEEDSEDDSCFVRDGVEYFDKCYFPEIDEDFFTSFISLAVWNVFAIEREKDPRTFTLGTIYGEYLKNMYPHNVHSVAVVADSFKLELLAHWAICHASHLNLNGETGGIELFSEFVKNIQNLNNRVNRKFKPFLFTGLRKLPDSLNSILARVHVPFLVRFSTNEQEKIAVAKKLKDNLGDFVQLGNSFRPSTKIGWDVMFEMKFDGQACIGFIECKLWGKVIGYASFFKYYKKACDSGLPLSFMVCKTLQKNISSSNAASNLATNLSKSVKNDHNYVAEIEEEEDYDSDLETIGRSKKPEVKKAKRVKKDYYSLLNDLWSDPKNHFDIYTVKYKNNRRSLSGKFKVSPLKTFPNPKGAFILVESTFDPSAISSHS